VFPLSEAALNVMFAFFDASTLTFTLDTAFGEVKEESVAALSYCHFSSSLYI
jgi:hypothetical protein